MLVFTKCIKGFPQIIVFYLLMASNVYCQEKTLGLTKSKPGSFENGYILFAPLECKTTYLIDRCGRKVNSWKSDYNPGLSAYLLPNGDLLRTGTLIDTFFRKGANGGIIEKLDWKGNVLWSYKLSNDSIGQHHDIYPMDNGNILVVVRHVITEEEAISKGRTSGTFGGNRLYSERILEIRPIGASNAEIVWQWSLWNHIIQDQDESKPNYGVVGDHPELMNINFAPVQSTDWIHINGIDYNKELDQILLSCKSISEIWIIDHSTTSSQAATHEGGKYEMGGDILYRWGNPRTYNKGTRLDQKFYSQHNANWISNDFKDGGRIMVFNNGLNRMPAYSSVEIIHPPMIGKGLYNKKLPYGPVSPNWIYKDSIPEKFFSGFKSGASRISKFNTLICSGLNGRFFELDSNKNCVWEYYNPVAQDDKILADGETGGSVVFKCLFYSDTFSGFRDKILFSSSPIERNSFDYDCSSICADTSSPKLVSLSMIAEKNDSGKSSLCVTFNEKIYKGTMGMLKIYENKVLKEVIDVGDSRIHVSKNKAYIKNTYKFKNNSHVSISISESCFKDFSGNKVKAIEPFVYKTKASR